MKYSNAPRHFASTKKGSRTPNKNRPGGRYSRGSSHLPGVLPGSVDRFTSAIAHIFAGMTGGKRGGVVVGGSR